MQCYIVANITEYPQTLDAQNVVLVLLQAHQSRLTAVPPDRWAIAAHRQADASFNRCRCTFGRVRMWHTCEVTLDIERHL